MAHNQLCGSPSVRQPTLESSVFGTEFVAMKNGIETNMLWAPLQVEDDGCAVELYHILCLWGNTLHLFITRSALNLCGRRSQTRCNIMRYTSRLVVMGESIITLVMHVPSVDNPADLLTYA
jgi:hypothetical protein